MSTLEGKETIAPRPVNYRVEVVRRDMTEVERVLVVDHQKPFYVRHCVILELERTEGPCRGRENIPCR